MADGAGRTRVLYVINDLARAGAETQLVALACALPPTRYEVRIVVLKERNDFADVLAAASIPVIALHRQGPADVGVAWRLAREVRRFRPQVLHSFLFPANLLAAVVGRALGVPRVIVSQRSSYDATLSAPWRRVARAGHRLAHRVIVNSRAALQEEIAAGASPRRLVYVPSAAPKRAASLGDRTGLGLADAPLVVSLGQLQSLKGHRYLIDAWPDVSRAHPQARLVLVGDGPCRGELAAQAARLGVSSSVTFAGFRSPADAYLAAADVFVQPSLTEGLPSAVLEAMAAGRAVVGTQAGGIAELIVDGQTGILVPSRDPGALAEGIKRLLDDPALRGRMGAAGLERVRTMFSIETVRDAIETIYGTGGA